MQSIILFQEEQGFNRKWAVPVVVASLVIAFAFCLLRVLYDKSIGLLQVFIALLLLSLGFLFLLNLRLDTIVKTDGIYVWYRPFHARYQYYSWAALKECYLRTYNPLTEFGGWGIRYGLSARGKAYNFSGRHGLQLVFKDGSKLLIGTGRPDELSCVLQKIGI